MSPSPRSTMTRVAWSVSAALIASASAPYIRLVIAFFLSGRAKVSVRMPSALSIFTCSVIRHLLWESRPHVCSPHERSDMRDRGQSSPDIASLIRATSVSHHRQFQRRRIALAPQHPDQRRAAVRNLGTVIVVGAGDREADAAAGGKAPRHRQKRNADALDLSRHKRSGVGARKRAEWPTGAIGRRRGRFLAMQSAQKTFRDISLPAAGLNLSEIDAQREVALTAREIEIGQTVAGELHWLIERCGGVVQHHGGSSLPVRIIVAAVKSGDTLIASVRPGTDGEIDLVLVRARARRGIGKTTIRCRKKSRARLDRRPGLRRAPLLRMDGKIMDRRFILQPGVEAEEIGVEEAQHFAKPGKFDLDRLAPGRTIDARAMIPGAEQEMARIVLLREIARDRTVHVARTIEPARDRQDGHIGSNSVRDRVGAERGGTKLGIVRQPLLAKAKLRHEIGLAEVAEMLPHSLIQQHTVEILIDRLRAFEVGIVEVGKLLENIAAIMIEGDHQLVIDLCERLQLDAAGKIVVAVGVPDGRQRRNGLDRAMAGGREKVGSGADIGNAGRANGAVRPGLGHDPVGNLARILALARRAETVAGDR